MLRFIIALATAGTLALLVAVLGRPGAKEALRQTGLRFDRVEIADHSGDVKLVGDIDGDGKQDLILGGLPRDPLTWWRWPDLHVTRIATPAIEFTTDGALADVDGDGDLDIVTGDGESGNNLVWFENPRPNGAPTDTAAWKRHEVGAAGGWVKDIEIADFDGDGRIDIAVRTRGEAMIFFQTAPGAWQKTALQGARLGEEGMFSGDIDGDGDTDIVLCGDWMQNPGGSRARDPRQWRTHHVGTFNPAFKAVVVDIDQDGRPDILTSSSEHVADIAWFRADAGPTGTWSRHVIQPSVKGAHTLQAADMDGDGDIDVVVGQMHTTKERELAIHFNVDGRGTVWERQVIDNVGLHNGVVADVDGDGDFDIYGANWAGHPPLRLWLNRLDPATSRRRVDRWTYHKITSAHVASFGLAFADVDGDGRTDIVSGPFWYRQPAGTWTMPWEQISLGAQLDSVAALDLDGDGRAEIIAQRRVNNVLQYVWLKAKDADARAFSVHVLGETPLASHDLGAQGHALVRLGPGAPAVFAASSASGTYYFEIPKDPAGAWRRVRISAETSDEGIAFGDIDRDGLLDLVATTGDAKEVAWWRNPGDGSSDWARQEIGRFPEAVYPDRVGVGDLDGDQRLDVVVTEENGAAEGAEAYWWQQPETLGSGGWKRHKITSRGSLNSLSVADVDADGKLDVVMGEHRGQLRVSIWRNFGGGRFLEQLIGKGMESHLGARAIDLDGDGDLDVVSIAWDAPATIHVWRNDAHRMPAGGSQESAGK